MHIGKWGTGVYAGVYLEYMCVDRGNCDVQGHRCVYRCLTGVQVCLQVCNWGTGVYRHR